MAKRRPHSSAGKKASSGWSEAHVRRLFWRAGFGATEAEARLYKRRGKAAALDYLMDPSPAKLRGREPRIAGRALDPVNEFGHDKLWWLDRMVRTNRPLEEKLTLFWHDHFATKLQPTPAMLGQNRMMRSRGLGSFARLLESVAFDPAMARWQSLIDNIAEAPNENFARELMELFTLGSGYTEADIREAARALTGLRARETAGVITEVVFDGSLHDGGRKTIFGQTGNWGVQDVLNLCVSHASHAPFMVSKLWLFFVGTKVPAAVRDQLAAQYVQSGLQLRPVIRSILEHPALYREPRQARHGQVARRSRGRPAADHGREGRDHGLELADGQHGPEPVLAAVGRGLGVGAALAVLQRDARALRRRQRDRPRRWPWCGQALRREDAQAPVPGQQGPPAGWLAAGLPADPSPARQPRAFLRARPRPVGATPAPAQPAPPDRLRPRQPTLLRPFPTLIGPARTSTAPPRPRATPPSACRAGTSWAGALPAG